MAIPLVRPGNRHRWYPRRLRTRLLLALIGILLAGFLLPEHFQNPVSGASTGDWHPQSYWYHPWGKSGVHKGVDIFGKKGQPVVSAVNGLVLSVGSGGRGGKRVIVLGPRWRCHYYAHLDHISTQRFAFVLAGERLGTMGDTGNAAGKPPHLHYVIFSMIPYPWRMRFVPQGWKRMVYLNPIPKLH